MKNSILHLLVICSLAIAASSLAADPTAIGEARSAAATKRMVTVQGIVHTVISDSWDSKTSGPRFMIQNTPAQADGDPKTSDGLFVSLDVDQSEEMPAELKNYKPRVGDEIVLQGRMLRTRDIPRLSFGTLMAIKRQGADPDAELENLLAQPPDDPEKAHTWWAEHEGMRIRLPVGTQAIGPLKGWAGRPRGEIALIAANHPLLQRKDPYMRRLFRAAHDLGSDVPKLSGNGMVILTTPPPMNEGQSASAPRTFDRLSTNVTGGVRFEDGQTFVTLHQWPAFSNGPSPDAQQPPAPEVTAPAVRIATMNIENLYDYTDDPFDEYDFENKKGKPEDYVPESDAYYRTRLTGLAQQIMKDLNAPDVLMLQEIEDQDIFPKKEGEAFRNDADGVPDVLADLIAEIKKQGGVDYRAGLDRTGADRRGITCGFLWRPDRVQIYEPKPEDPLLGQDPQRAISTGNDLVFYGFSAAPVRALNLATASGGRVMSRGIQVLAVTAPSSKGEAHPLYILNNHFKSQPTEYLKQRVQQAEFNAHLASLLMKRDPEARVLMGGDLNTYPRPDDATPEKPSDSLGPLYTAGMENLYIELLHRQPASAYTYLHQGTAQTLDQMFVSPALRKQLLDVRVLHINSDYTYDPKAPSRGTSDHDPVLATFAW